MAPPVRKAASMTPCERTPAASMRRLLLGDDAAILVHHQVTLGKTTRCLLGRSIPNLTARANYAVSLHCGLPRKFRAGGGTSTNPVYSTLPQ